MLVLVLILLFSQLLISQSGIVTPCMCNAGGGSAKLPECSEEEGLKVKQGSYACEHFLSNSANELISAKWNFRNLDVANETGYGLSIDKDIDKEYGSVLICKNNNSLPGSCLQFIEGKKGTNSIVLMTNSVTFSPAFQFVSQQSPNDILAVYDDTNLIFNLNKIGEISDITKISTKYGLMVLDPFKADTEEEYSVYVFDTYNRVTKPYNKIMVIKNAGNPVVTVYKDAINTPSIFSSGHINSADYIQVGTNLYVGANAYASNFVAGDGIVEAGSYKIKGSGDKPICDVSNRGLMWFGKSTTDAPDTFEICVKDVGDNYVWKSLF